MLIKRLISRLAIGTVLLAAGAALPAVARDNDDDHGDHWRHHHHDHGDRHWQHGHDRDDGYAYPPETLVYEPYYVEPRVYYPPAYVYPQPREGVTIIFRNHW